MKWLVLLCLAFTSCGAITVSYDPIKPPQKQQYSHRHKVHHVKPKATPAPIPNPNISPLPPDERIQDIVRQLKSPP